MAMTIPAAKSPALAWTGVCAWTVVIFLTIPVARKIQAALEQRAAPGIYVAAAAAVAALFLLFGLYHVLREAGPAAYRRLGWLVGLGGLCVWLFRTQLQTPVEAMHFIQYGVLGLLFFRAWRLSAPDMLVYPVAWLSTGLVAWLDEFLQWLMPGRYWDYRDVRLNLLAGGLALLAIAAIFRPGGLARSGRGQSRRWLFRLAGALWLALGLSLACTPAGVDRIAARIPRLKFLYNNESVMTEFGLRHEIAGIGTFKSRFTLEELAQGDAARADRLGAAMRPAGSLTDFKEFRRRYPVTADPFLFEAASRLRRRDHYYATAWKYRETDPPRMAYHLAVAWGENQILERFFPRLLAAARCQWPAERRAACLVAGDLRTPYTSIENGHLITGFSEAQAWALWLAGGGLLGLAGFGWRAPGRALGGLPRRRRPL